MNEVYLSDILDTNAFKKGALNIIQAPCGCGKTHAAINKIATLASCPSKALYLIDTVAGCQRVSNEKNMALPCLYYDEDIVTNHTFDSEFDKSKVVVATYAKFGVWCSRNDNFSDNFEVIVCDEVHNLVEFAAYSSEGNFTDVAKKNLCSAIWRGTTLFVGITATPEPLKKLACPQSYVPIDTSILHHYTEKQVIPYASVPALISTFSKDMRGVIYVRQVTPMIEYARIAKAFGLSPICIWSLNYSKVPMDEEQKRVREYLLKNEEVPPEYNLLIINASCETAINIRSHMDYFVVHNTNQTHITQARGRYRGNLDKLFILDKENGAVIVPQKYLEIKLFKEERAALSSELQIKTDKGKPIALKKLKELIANSGYTYSEGRQNNRPYILIQPL